MDDGKILFYFLLFDTGSLANIGYYIFDISGVHTGANGAIYGILGFYLYLYLLRLIDPNSGMGLLLLVNQFGSELVVELSLSFIAVWRLLFGMIIIEIRRLKVDEDMTKRIKHNRKKSNGMG